MPAQYRNLGLLAVCAMALGLTVSAHAAATRTFVATTGDDANTTSNCSATANCRTFAAALSVTSPGGEIVVVNSGGYGPVAIGQSVIITADGVNASISVTTSGANGLTIDTTGDVTLTGLKLHGEATGNDGVYVQRVGNLRLDNVMIENFVGFGVQILRGGLYIHDSIINDNAGGGLYVEGTPANTSAFVDNTSFDNNFTGAQVVGPNATFTNSSFSNSQSGMLAANGTITLDHVVVAGNNLGMEATTFGSIYFAHCLLFNNTTAYEVGEFGAIDGSFHASTLITPGQATVGSLSGVRNLQ